MKLVLLAFLTVGLLLAAPASRNWENLGQLTSGVPIEVFTSDR